MKLPAVSFSLSTIFTPFTRKTSSQGKVSVSSDHVQLVGWMQIVVPALIALLGVSVFGCSVLAFCTCLTVFPGIGLVLLGSLLLFWAYHKIVSMRVNMALDFNSSSNKPIQ